MVKGGGPVIRRRSAAWLLASILLAFLSACDSSNSPGTDTTPTPNRTRTPTPTATVSPTATPTGAGSPTPTATPTCGPSTRQVSIVNDCNYTVWLGSAGGAVSCSGTSAICTGQNSSPHACVDSSKNPNVPAYQCTCGSDLDCPDAGDKCSTQGFCFKGLPAFTLGGIELKAASTGNNFALLCLPAAVPTSTPQAIQWSGAIFGRAGCPDAKFEGSCAGGGQSCTTNSDCCNNDCAGASGNMHCVPGVPACATGDCDASIICPAGAGGLQPATEFEATMDSRPSGGVGPSDWYDVTAINGINVPMEAALIPGTFAAPGSGSPYECANPGAPSPSSGLLGCDWQVPTPAATSSPPWGDATSMRLIDPTTAGSTQCNQDSDCGTPGQICGLAYTPTAGPNGNLARVCGYPAGTWGPVTVCGLGSSGLGPISGAFQCGTAMCNATPGPTPDPNFPGGKLPGAQCAGGEVNFPVIKCTQQGANSECAKAPGTVCDLNASGNSYCVPVMSTGTSTTGVSPTSGTTCPSGYNYDPVTKLCFHQFCPAGAYYDSTSTMCLQGSGSAVTCVDDTSCSSGFTCTSGITGQSGSVCAITAQCVSNLDCPSSGIPFLSCSNGNNVSSVNAPTPTPTPLPGQCVPNLYSTYGATAYTPQSFFNSGTTNYQQATGWTDWASINGGVPLPNSMATPTLPANPNWTTYALPFESLLKGACPTAYSYQYDDPYSTFTCTSASDANQIGYTITFCPAGSPNNATFPTPTPTP